MSGLLLKVNLRNVTELNPYVLMLRNLMVNVYLYVQESSFSLDMSKYVNFKVINFVVFLIDPLR